MKYIKSGISVKDDNVYIDYTYNHQEDIINIVSPQLYKSTIHNKIYWFGYQFNENTDSKTRTKFIHYIKGIGDRTISDSDLTQLIERPLGYLDEEIDIYSLDCIVYPLSNRSMLVSKIISVINSYSSRDTGRINFELVKSCPTDIQFDWNMFNSDYEGSQGYKQMCDYINKNLLPKIHNLDYFSIAKNVKPKYRKYITNFFKFEDPNIAYKFSQLQGKKILVVDDINTSGSTLDEILRIIDKINNNCNIYIFTLLGKE